MLDPCPFFSTRKIEKLPAFPFPLYPCFFMFFRTQPHSLSFHRPIAGQRRRKVFSSQRAATRATTAVSTFEHPVSSLFDILPYRSIFFDSALVHPSIRIDRVIITSLIRPAVGEDFYRVISRGELIDRVLADVATVPEFLYSFSAFFFVFSFVFLSLVSLFSPFFSPSRIIARLGSNCDDHRIECRRFTFSQEKTLEDFIFVKGFRSE